VQNTRLLTVATNDEVKDIKKLSTDCRSIISFESDYEIRRLGIKPSERMIILEYFIPTKKKRYHHYIKLIKFHPGFLVNPLTEKETL
jgi:hypothetical protein